MWLGGLGMVVIANIATGFCTTRIPYDVCRGLAGVGIAMACEDPRIFHKFC